MGLLDILNGMQNGPRGQTEPGKGGMSPITMGLLALLAYKAYQKWNESRPATAPAGNAGATPSQSQGGGLGDILSGGLGNILQGGRGGGASGGGLGGALGGLLAGAGGGSILSGGLNDLLKQLEQNGHGDVAKSWVGTGANKNISADDLGKALDDDTVNTLAEQAGLSRVELLNSLSQQLPQAIDHMTPQGRMPTEHEISKML
jgi:uncharacterized protein YidB (DUF937 family)